MSLLEEIVARAKADKQRIVLPEAEEERTLKAADHVLADDIADIILIGNPAHIKQEAEEWGLKNINKTEDDISLKNSNFFVNLGYVF